MRLQRIGVSVFRQWILVVDVPWHQSVGRQWTRHRPKGPSHSPPSHHHPSSAVPDSLIKKRGGGLNRHFKDSRQHPAQDRGCCTHTEGYPRFPDLRPIGTPIPSPVPGRIGKRGFPIPDSGRVGNRGFPSPFPGQIGNRGNGNWGFPGLPWP